jgi:hypothetical protein
MSDSANVAIAALLYELQGEPTAPWWPSERYRQINRSEKHYRSGSAIVVTTQEADEIQTVPLWPSVRTTRVDSVKMTIDN